MIKIIQKNKDTNSEFLCTICKMHNSSLQNQNVRSLVFHFLGGNHSKHMKKKNVSDIQKGNGRLNFLYVVPYKEKRWLS